MLDKTVTVRALLFWAIGILAIYCMARAVRACNFFPLAPRNYDWVEGWRQHEGNLKAVVELIKQNKLDTASGASYIQRGMFAIPAKYGLAGMCDSKVLVATCHSDSRFNLGFTATFYTDPGLLDHYSAFVYASDSSTRVHYHKNVDNSGNDYCLGDGWFMIND